MQRVRLLLLLAVLVLAAGARAAAAEPALDGAFPLSGQPDRLAAGPDGNVWFTLKTSSASKEFGKIAPDGTVSEYDSPDNTSMVGITTGPDQNLWATEINKVVRIDPAN